MGATWILLLLLAMCALLAKLFGVLRGGSIFLGLFVLLIAFVNMGMRHTCVVMSNGLLIGRATVFSQMYADEYGSPDIAIKHPDGRLVRRGDGSINFYDQESVGGDYPGSIGHRTNRFIYIKNVGLLLESEEPDRFQFYWDQKKRPIPEPSSVIKGQLKPNKFQRRKDVDIDGRQWKGDYDTWLWADGASSNLYLLYSFLYSNPKNRRNWCTTAWFKP